MRNLMRLRAAGIAAPAPVQLRMHVLVMEFIGDGGVAAPRLRDAGLPLPRLRGAYTEMLLIVRKLYQQCRLVHADLSEYNILVHQVSCGTGAGGRGAGASRRGSGTGDVRALHTCMNLLHMMLEERGGRPLSKRGRSASCGKRAASGWRATRMPHSSRASQLPCVWAEH